MSRDGETPSFVDDLTRAVRSGTPIIYVDTTEDERVQLAFREMGAMLGARLFIWTATEGLQECFDDVRPSEPQKAASAEELLKLLIRLEKGSPTDRHVLVLALDLVGAHDQQALELRLFKDLFRKWEPEKGQSQLASLVMTGAGWTLPAMLAGYVDTRALPLPRREEIEADFAGRQDRLEALGLTPKLMADRSAGLPKLAIEQVFRGIEAEARREARSEPGPRQERALASIESAKKEEIRRTNLLEIIPVTKDIDLGGFARFKRWFEVRKEFLLEPGRDSLRPRGVIFLGYPGCGKSHAARWIAKELRLPLVAMDFGRVQDRWVGSSEARLNTALKTIEATAPLVLFIDEIEKAFAGAGEETNGVTTRMMGQFLTWLSDRQVPVFIVATCNSAKIPPELTRVGRFDANFLVLLPGEEERAEVCKAVVAALGVVLEDQVREEVARATAGYTGAEIRQVVVEAAYRAGFKQTRIGLEHALLAIPEVAPLSRREKGMKLREDYEKNRADGGYINAGEDP